MTDQQDTPSPQHYFTARPEAPSVPRQVVANLRGQRLRLWTDHGVFSYGSVDRASRLLTETVVLPPAAEVLDWGAGYGTIGLALALSDPACYVTLVEVNERAAALAQRNASENGAGNVAVICGAAPQALGDRRFDVVVSNPPLHVGKAAVELVIEDAGERLREGGELWLVIPTRKGAKGFLELMSRRFAATRTATITGGFRVLWGQKSK